MWRQQHVVGHHAHTNIDGLDPDIRVGEKDVRRVTPTQPWHPYMARPPLIPHPHTSHRSAESTTDYTSQCCSRPNTPNAPSPPQVYQHVYLAVLYGALAIKSIYLDDFKALFDGNIGAVTLSKLNVRALRCRRPAIPPCRPFPASRVSLHPSLSIAQGCGPFSRAAASPSRRLPRKIMPQGSPRHSQSPASRIIN